MKNFFKICTTFAVFLTACNEMPPQNPTVDTWHFEATGSMVCVDFLSFEIEAAPDYHAVEYWFGPAAEVSDTTIAEFETGKLTGIVSKTDIFRTIFAPAFGLEPNTEYCLLVRAKDRYGKWSETKQLTATTLDPASAPYVTTTEGELWDFWITQMEFKPNDKVASYIVFVTGLGDYNHYFELMDGDCVKFLQDQMGGAVINQGDLSVVCENVNMSPDTIFEAYILMLDAARKPIGLTRKIWNAPPSDDSYNEVAHVEIDVTPTTEGGSYAFTPNEHTVAFACETFLASLIDGDDPWDPGAKDDEWIKDWITGHTPVYASDPATKGKQWHYRNMPEYWTLAWNDNSNAESTTGEPIPSGTELVVAVVAYNKNGLGGVGDVTTKRYTKL